MIYLNLVLEDHRTTAIALHSIVPKQEDIWQILLIFNIYQFFVIGGVRERLSARLLT